MKIVVKAKTGAKSDTVERIQQDTLPLGDPENICYRVSVKARPVAGEANLAIVRVLAKYFGIAPSCVLLKSGEKSKQKVFEILR